MKNHAKEQEIVIIPSQKKRNIHNSIDFQILKKIAKEIGQAISLYWFDSFPFHGIDYSRSLQESPCAIGSQGMIYALKLNNLSLHAFPQEILKLANLQILDFSFNRLTKFPFEILTLPNLVKFNLNFNPIFDKYLLKKNCYTL